MMGRSGVCFVRRRVLQGVCVIGAAFTVLWTMPISASATAPGTNGPIVFSWGGEIYTVRPDGMGLTHVVRSAQDQNTEFSPSWSPDGKRIVAMGQMVPPGTYFWTRPNPQLFAPDGTDFVRLSTPYCSVGCDLAWSPDGSRIAYTTDVLVDAPILESIYTTTPDGSSITPILQGNAVEPAWSPDGSHIVFVRSVGPGFFDQTSLYTMSSDGSDVRLLLAQPGKALDPSWSPDGKTIAFTSRLRDADGSYLGSYIATVPATGGQPTKLTDSRSDESPAWSPDGTTIVFQSDRGNVSDLYLMDADGSNQRRLTYVGCSQCDPDWASLPPHPSAPQPPPPAPMTVTPRTAPRRQQFAALVVTPSKFVRSASARIRFWTALPGHVRFTITRMEHPALVHGCRRRPHACRTVRRVSWRVRQGLNTVPFDRLPRRVLPPAHYRLDLSSSTGTTHVSASFQVVPAREGRPRR